MIVIGYPGVGKSTVSKRSITYIDLDSSIFNKDEKDWEKEYIKTAEKLSAKGHVVFVSAHKKVQELLLNSSQKILVVYPALRLHDFWIKKLRDRYAKSEKPEFYRALQRCVSHYCEDILELKALPFDQLKIDTEVYDLEVLLEKYL